MANHRLTCKECGMLAQSRFSAGDAQATMDAHNARMHRGLPENASDIEKVCQMIKDDKNLGEMAKWIVMRRLSFEPTAAELRAAIAVFHPDAKD